MTPTRANEIRQMLEGTMSSDSITDEELEELQLTVMALLMERKQSSGKTVFFECENEVIH